MECPDPTVNEWISIVIQTLLLVVGAAYTIYTAKQVNLLRASVAETRNSNVTAKEALVLSRRVWLTATIQGAPIKLGGSSDVVVLIHNHGNMPAASIQLSITPTLQPSTIIESGTPTLDFARVAPLSVQATARYEVALDSLGDLTQKLYREGQVLHVLALVKYDDGFGKERYCHFGWYATGRSLDRWNFTPGVHALE